jgi:putative tryptophan/tyrosine transport system ATP-binding protein
MHMTINPILSIDHLSYSLKSGKEILSDITYQIYASDFIVIIGPNGSGKSSLLKIIAGLNDDFQGSIKFKNKAISREDFQQISLSDQTNDLNLCPSMTIYENYSLFLINQEQAISKIEAKEYLSQFDPRFVDSLDIKVARLSAGQKQKLSIALFLLRKPEILLLDEFTSALDPKTSEQILDMTVTVLKQFKITCLMTIHNIPQALKYGNKLIAINDGKIVFSADETEKKSLTKNQLLGMCY